MHVLLCVEADARVDGLRRLLRSLARQRFTRGPEPGVSVVVVDASPGALAERAVAELREALRWPVEYVAEPAADLGRRKVVALALGCGADCVAFLDADAAPSPDWLEELLVAQSRHQADVVAGPVVPRYADAVPMWVRRGGFFESPRRRTGEPVPLVRPSNVLVMREVLAAAAGGASWPAAARRDTGRHAEGLRVVWADQAVVETVVDSERATARWILRRAFQERMPALPPHAVVLGRHSVPPSAARALVRMAEGGFLLSVAVFLGRAGIMHALCRLSRGAGELTAALRGSTRPREPA
ncbi:MAG TPA: glycosyltransferase [Longimicrobiales bacterium]